MLTSIDSINNVPSNVSNQKISLDTEKAKKIGIDVALTLLSLPTNLTSCNPLKYYNASYLSICGRTNLSQFGIVEDEMHPVPAIDQLLYHAALYFFSKVVFPPANNEVLLTLMSAPAIMKKMTEQSWFIDLKKGLTDLGIIFSINGLFQALQLLGENQVNNYFENKFFRPVREILSQNPETLLKNFQDSVQACLAERMQIVVDLRYEAKKIPSEITKLGETLRQPHRLEKAVDKLDETTQKIKKLFSIPEISLLPKKRAKTSVGLTTKAMVAWSVAANIHPFLAPLVFNSTSPDLAEISTRVGGALLTAATSQSLACAVLTEIAVKATPRKVRNWFASFHLTDRIGQHIAKGTELITEVKSRSVMRLMNQGYSTHEIDIVGKSVAQLYAGSFYHALCHQNDPLMHMMTASSFMGYLGILADHHQIAPAKHFTSEVSPLESLPLTVVTGCALKALEMGLNLPRMLTSLVATILFSPLVSDTIVQSDLYQHRVVTRIKEGVIPHYRLFRLGRTASKALQIFPSCGKIYACQIAKYLALGAVGVAATLGVGKVIKAATHPTSLKIMKFIKNQSLYSAASAFSLYGKYSISAGLAPYIGDELTALAQIASKPKDAASLRSGNDWSCSWLCHSKSTLRHFRHRDNRENSQNG